MSWGGYLKGKNGVDLFKKYNINYQLLGLGANTVKFKSKYGRSEIRQYWEAAACLKRQYMRIEFMQIQNMVRDNYKQAVRKWQECSNCGALERDFRYCPYCGTKALMLKEDTSKFTDYWLDKEMMERFLSINPNEVYDMGGGC